MGGISIPIKPPSSAYNAQLINGAKSGEYNKTEFTHLNSLRNRIEFLEAENKKPGKIRHNNSEELNRLRKEYGSLSQLYKQGDFQCPMGPTPSMGDRGVDARLANQSSRIYDGLTDGGITRREGMGLLAQQRGVATGLGGSSNFGGGVSNDGRNQAHHQLDRSSGSIWNARHNWVTDWNPFGTFNRYLPCG